jgi:demethylmenaquinone methyltransferase/2-methoxy-6-polyprenyl-1,4-benzoquinol methylase
MAFNRMQSQKHGGKKYPGVKEMTISQQIGIVRNLFSTIYQRYDFLNHFFSFGCDLAWRRFAVKKMRFFQTNRFLDVATGTADLAIEAARKNPHIQVTGIDFVREMLTAGQQKISRRRLVNRVHLLSGDALKLPFPDSSFDVAGIAFGIRNIPEHLRALKEMTRVVVPSGQVMVLEMHVPQNRAVRGLYSLYLNRVLPWTARLFSRNPSAYYYLADSITHFPSPEAFSGLMEEAGLTRIERYALSWGVAFLHVGIKLPPTVENIETER